MHSWVAPGDGRRGVSQRLARRLHRGRTSGADPDSCEDRPLERFLPQRAGGDLRDCGGQQRRQEGNRPVFALTLAAVLLRRGLFLGATAGGTAYVACSILVANLPLLLSAGLAIAMLAVGPRLMPQRHLRPPSPRPAWSTALTCGAAFVIVGAALLTSRLAGPELAGAVAAFPTMCLTFTVVVVNRDGRHAGVHALSGLVRSLPCYLTFCVVAAVATPLAGSVAIPLGLLAGLTAAFVTWRGVPVVRRAALVQ